MSVKHCNKCDTDKSTADFYKRNGSPCGIMSICKQCSNKQTIEYRKKNPEKILQYNREYKDANRDKINESWRNNEMKKTQKRWAYKILYSYNMTPEQWDDMYIAQGGRCAICGVHQSELKKRLNVDHCHETGKNRGLLCPKCNTAIGLMNDNANIMSNAIKYLESSNGNTD